MSSKRRSRKDDPEEGAHKTTPQRKPSPQSSALDEERQHDGGVRDNDDDEDDDLEDENADSEDGSLLIVDMQDSKDTDDTERDSVHSEEEEQTQLVFNGTMTRRQSRQFQDAGENFAVFSVRSGIKTKNRTCEYCGVAKATPAALVRHIRKHTGEKPFICQLCGKAYKAKRSLHLHQNSHHRDTGQMLPPNLSAPPTQVSLSLSLHPQNSPTQAISEATKSLLRETLESSRKARDGSIGTQIPESVTGISPRVSERLPTPNLVNLLTTDLTNKAQPATEPIFLTKAVDLSKVAMDTSTNFILSPPLIKKEKEDEVKDEEEQAQDLSMQTMQKVASVSGTRQSSLERKLKCELCNKSFKHDVSHTNHLRTAHNIVITVSESQLPKQLNNSFTILEQKPSSNPSSSLSQGKSEAIYQRQDVPTDLSIMALHSRKVLDTSGGSLSHDALKMESPLMSSTEALMLDESDTLPYNVTSRMVQDFDLEKLSVKGTDTSILAEDGGNRRLRMTVSRETVLATRLDGINNITGRQATVFKCHLCSRVFSSMLRFYHHLPSHFDTEIHTFDCRYCEAAFRSLTQIVKHLQCHREKFTGLNQSGTGLNSSALLLEEFHKKHKQDHAENGSLSNSATSLFSPVLHSEELLNGTAQPEPGERTNGGYTCVKCRKSFSREYLLQRHMRIHQTQNTFYCPDCESSFSREVDVVEHQKKVHGLKSAEQLQYSSLLKNISDLKQSQGSRQAASTISDSNNNNSSSSSLNIAAPNSYPLVDMKAFDLRLGEAVEVRVASDVAALDRDELVRRAMLEQYKVLMLSGQRGSDQIRHALATLAATELERRKKLKDGKMKREAEEESRVTEEVEKRRKVEQEQLKEKLAQEGMGDVTVVLPDAPPPDDAADASLDMDRPRDLSVTSGPTSGVGFMARKTAAGTALTTSQYGLGLQAEVGPVGSVMQGRQVTLDAATTISETAGGLKRIIPSSADPVSEPPSKNRRKAHKPQKINHIGEREKLDYMDEVKGEDSNNNKTTVLTPPQYNPLQGIVQSLKASKPATDLTVSEIISPFSNNGAIDLTTDNKDPHARLSATELLYLASRKIAVSSSSSCSNSSFSSSPPTEGILKEEHNKNSSSIAKLDRSDSVDLSAFDSDNSQLSEAAQATDLSKTSLLSVQIPTDQDGLVGYPRVSWKNGNQRSNEASENILGIIHGGQWNGKASKTMAVVTSKSQASSPSPVPSPTNSDTSSTTEGRKVTITSLSRTHSRLSVVNEPLDRNSLCKPQVLDDGRSVYTCIICHKQFLSLSDINRHMDFHEDIRPYKCKYCDYYARTNSQLKVHKLRHEGVREFCCRVCNYKGVTQSDLNRHMKSQVHLLRSNHVCSQCGEGFVTPKTLRDHVCCTGSANKSFENSSANEIDDDADNEDYDDEENVNSETSQGSSTGVSKEVKVGAS